MLPASVALEARAVADKREVPAVRARVAGVALLARLCAEVGNREISQKSACASAVVGSREAGTGPMIAPRDRANPREIEAA